MGISFGAKVNGQNYKERTGAYAVAFDGQVREPVEQDHTLMWIPVEDCFERMFSNYQIWAVKTAWEREKEKEK